MEGLGVTALPFSPAGTRSLVSPAVSTATTPLASPVAQHLDESERVIRQVIKDSDEDRKRALSEVRKLKGTVEALALQLKQKVIRISRDNVQILAEVAPHFHCRTRLFKRCSRRLWQMKVTSP
jgi:hypothetical protein